MKNSNMKIVAIVAAAGQGKRLGLGYNKNFMLLSGQPVLVHSISTLRKYSNIVEIIVVVAKNEISAVQEMLNNNDEPLKCIIVAGGSKRQHSIFNAIKMIKSDAEVTLIHDGARPLADEEVIIRVTLAATKYQAAAAAVPVKDTIKAVDEKRFVSSTPDRTLLWAVQTPQAFRTSILKKAYILAKIEGYLGTDDASLVERVGVKVKLVDGSYSNIKITTPEDIIIAEALAEKRSQTKMRVGFGYDVHQLAEGRKLIMGGVEVPYKLGLAGHSDADVLLHAIQDALLGAAAFRDIGCHFSDQDPQYKGISSLFLLEAVSKKLLTAGYRVNNLDATIVAEKPRLKPFIEEMNENIAKVLLIKLDQVNVKATTTEGLGFSGRQEGIAAYAVATICNLS